MELSPPSRHKKEQKIKNKQKGQGRMSTDLVPNVPPSGQNKNNPEQTVANTDNQMKHQKRKGSNDDNDDDDDDDDDDDVHRL